MLKGLRQQTKVNSKQQNGAEAKQDDLVLQNKWLETNYQSSLKPRGAAYQASRWLWKKIIQQMKVR